MENCLSSSYQAFSGFRKEGKLLLMLSFTGHGLASWKWQRMFIWDSNTNYMDSSFSTNLIYCPHSEFICMNICAAKIAKWLCKNQKKNMDTSLQLCHAVGLHWFHRADFKKLLSHIFGRFLTTCRANDNETIMYSYWIDKLLRLWISILPLTNKCEGWLYVGYLCWERKWFGGLP